MKRLSEALEEKRDEHGRWSSFRLALALMVIAWIVRFLWQMDAELSGPMAWLGIGLIAAAMMRPWMARTDPSVVADVIKTALKTRGS